MSVDDEDAMLGSVRTPVDALCIQNLGSIYRRSRLQKLEGRQKLIDAEK
jgi:hypothetical protein